MKPLGKATMQTIKRFPELYKRQAMQVIHAEVDDAIRTTADSFVMAALLVLVEEFGFGTSGANATRVQRFMGKLQEVIDVNAEYYDDAVAEGLRNKLSYHGITYTSDADK